MSVRKPRAQGKGDGRRDNLEAFQKNFPKLKANEPRGRVFIKKANRTVLTYR
jgi:hypothetical protein